MGRNHWKNRSIKQQECVECGETIFVQTLKPRGWRCEHCSGASD